MHRYYNQSQKQTAKHCENLLMQNPQNYTLCIKYPIDCLWLCCIMENVTFSVNKRLTAWCLTASTT